MIRKKKFGQRLAAMFMALTMTATMLPTSALAVGDENGPSLSQELITPRTVRLLVDIDDDGQYDKLSTAQSTMDKLTVALPESVETVNAKLVMEVGHTPDEDDPTTTFWTSNQFAFSVENQNILSESDKAALNSNDRVVQSVDDMDMTALAGLTNRLYYVPADEPNADEGAEHAYAVIVANLDGLSVENLKDGLSYEIKQYGNGGTLERTSETGAKIGVTVTEEAEEELPQPEIELKVQPKDGLKAGDTFTVTATSNTSDGRISFTYNGKTKTVPVEVKGKDPVYYFAKATFEAVEGNYTVEAYQYGDNLEQSERATIEVTASKADAPQTYTITVAKDSPVEVTVPDGATTGTGVEAGTTVTFEVTDPTATEVTVMAGDDYVDVAKRTSTVYTFEMPASNVTIKAAAPTINKVATTTTIQFDEADTEFVAGETIKAAVHVTRQDGSDINAPGAQVQVTWPDGTISYVPLSDIGYADATWVVTDAFADSLKAAENGNEVEIQAQFRGSELYAASGEASQTIAIKSRTLSSDGVTLGLEAVNGTQDTLTVGKESTLTLNGEVKDKQGQVATDGYTVVYYQSTNGGATWKSVPGDGQVTPTSTNDAFKAIVSPKGDYTQGAFEVVCAVAPKEATPVVTVSVDDGSIMQGQSATLTAEVKVGETNVAGGTVKFYAAQETNGIVGAAVDYLHRAWVGVQSLFGAGPEDTTLPEGAMYLGEGNVVDGTANFVLTNTAQLEGAYTIYAQYSGYPTMYTTAVSADNATLTVNSATLPSEGWTIGTEGENPSSNLESMEIGEEYELKVYAPNALKHGEDYTTQWYASMDGGLTWVLAGTEKTLTVTPENNLYQYKAVVFPAGDYTEPRNGVSVGTVTTEANAQNDTSIAFTLPAQDNYSVFPGDPIKLQVFVTDTTLTGDDEGAVEVPAVGGTVTFYAGKTELGTVALDGAGYATWDVIGGITETTTFKAEYSGTEQYDGCTTATDNNITVKVKSTELTWADSNDEIQVDGTITAGSVVTLTPPAVAVKGEDNTDLTYGVDYYYQWQYATDYNLSEDGKGTATWLNFSAPEVEGTDHAIRVNVPTENTAFRVLAVPAGNYTQPLPGLESETAVGGSVLKITPYISMAAENANPDRDAGEYFNGDSVKFTVTVKETETGSVFLNEGVVSLKIGSTIVDVEPVLNGTATFVVPVPTENTTYTAVFSATNKYERAQTDGIEITPKTVEIAVNTNGVIKAANVGHTNWNTNPLTVQQAYTVRFPIVYAADDTAYEHALTYGTDYRVEWFLDTGNGWNAYNPEQDSDGYKANDYVSGSESVPTFTFTPVNEDTRLRAVVYPIGNYMLPEAGIAAGMLTTGEKVATTTSIDSNVDTDYEGNIITLTATVTANQEAVLDGTVDFYAGEAYIGTATLNGEGQAIMQYTLPAYVYGANTVTFTAKYTGTTAYEASEDAEGVTVKVQSARISFLKADSMTITIRDGENLVERPTVGTSYTLTAPDVYENGDPSKKLTCGTGYFYVWEYSEDGTNWTTAKIGNGSDGQTYMGAFGTDNAEYRATAYPMNPYKYPESGITAKTNTEPQVKDTATALEIGNAYTKSGDVSIYPVGRKIELKATVTDTAAQAPAAGMVTFYQWQSGVGTTSIGQVYLNPVGEATLTIPAPEEGQFIYFAVFSTNDIYGQSSSVNLESKSDPTVGPAGGTAVNVVVLNNTVKTTNDGKLNVAGKLQDGKMVVGQEYTLSGVEGTVDVKKNGLDTYVQAVLAEHKANAANPFYTYQWQKSTDGGNTWTDITSNSNDGTIQVVYDTDRTLFRVVIMPYAPSGWTMPVAGAESQPVGANPVDPNATITVTDDQNMEIANETGTQDENKTVTVTVNLTNLPDYEYSEDGIVTLTTFRGTEVNMDTNTTEFGEAQTQTVDRSGIATFQVTLPDYEYKSASDGKNVIRFYAEYTGNGHFTDDTRNAYLRLTPAAITWAFQEFGTNHDFTDAAKNITIYEGNQATGDSVTKMEANKAYTLAIPTIYAADNRADGATEQAELTFGTDFTVQWQRRLTEGGAAWEDITEGTGETLYLPQGAEGYNYRAVITPTGEYTKAMQDWPNGPFTLAIGTVLTTNSTTPTGLTPTTTALEIQNTVKEANNVQVNDAFPFGGEGATGSHDTQYEGEDVKLVATVTEAGGNVQDGYVNFYRYVDGTNDVLLNETPIEIQDGKAELDVTTSAWTDSKGVLENVDRYYAVYEGTNVYEESATISRFDSTFAQDALKDVYIRSTAIEIPRIGATVGDETKYTTRDADLTDLPAAQTITFTLVQNNTMAVDGFSVTATDGRWLTAGEDFTMQWYLQGKDVSDGGSSNANEPILGANLVQYIKENASVGEKYSIELIPAGHMQTGATSKQAIIGSASTPLVLLDPGYTFEPTASDVADGVSTTPGAHYGDEVTLTATVTGNTDTNALPTGTVTFYYRAGNKWTPLSEPINLEQKDVAAGKLTAQATYTFNASELPFNVDAICFNYSGDDFYTSHQATETQDANGNKARYYFKLWSTQISNPAREGVDFTAYTPDYTDAACYPDSQSYGNVEISIYKAQKDGDTFVKGNQLTADDSVQANGDYILELNDVYTKSGEKLEAKLDNAGDISIEWFQSTDGGNTWSPVQVTELSDAEALTVYVKPETKDTKYMVKVTTNNSFYNSAKPELVDYEYSEEHVDVTLQTVSVNVTAQAETPVAGNADWVYQRNPITLFATVSPSIANSGEPTGTVAFYYAVLPEGATYDEATGRVNGDFAEITWNPVVSDKEDGSNTAALEKTTSATDTAGTMVAQLTTSNLPVSSPDGTYSQLVIKAVYQGDQTYQASDNMGGNAVVASPIVHVFSSTANHDTDIQNKVISTTVVDGKLTGWGADDKPTDGAIIFAKNLVSDGTDAVLTLNGVFTRDADDATDAVINNNASIYTMDNETEYTVEWQYCPDYEAYKDYLENPSADDALGAEGKNWKTVEGSTNAMTCNVSMIQAYAFRAKITFNEEPQSMASYTEYKNNLAEPEIDSTKVIYSNILVVGDAEARVFTNIRKASSASKTDDKVCIDVFAMGGSTTPVGSVTVSIYETGAEDAEPVFQQTRNVANGYTVFDWTAKAGIYKIVTEFEGNNGYNGQTAEDYIVRFTDDKELDITDELDQRVVYNGQVQMMDVSKLAVNGFGDTYTDLATMAQQSLVFEYTDANGNRVAEPVDAGTYTVKAYLPESKYWGYVEATGTFTIEKRAVEITDVIAQAKTYDGDAVANVQTVELAQSELAENGLPKGTTGVVEGDSVYVNATAAFNSANVKEANELTLTSAVLSGPDAGNYTITNPKYSEEDTIARNQLAGSIVTSITAPTGYTLTDDDFYLIDQSGERLTVADGAYVTYYYHSGNDIAKAADTSKAGKYTVIVDAGDTANYKGGLTTTLYIEPNTTKSVVGTVADTATSALIDITDTNHVYDGTAKAVTATATNDADVTVEYAGADGKYTTTAPTDAGRYMVKATANGATAYGIMTIVKGEPGVTIFAADVVYDGTRYNGQTLHMTDTLYADNEDNGSYGELYYTYVGGSIVGYSYNAPIDVSYVPDGAYVDSETSGAYGEYAVSAHVPETANTVADIVSAEFQITKADLTVSAQEVYTRLFDTNSKMTSTYEGFQKNGDRGVDNSIRDFIAMPTYTIEGLDTDAMNEVGPFTLAVSNVNVRNYAVTYEDNQVVINDQATQDALELRHELGGNNVVYFGQQFNVFLYGSRVDNQVNESSVVRYVSSNPSVATVDEKTGLVEVVGVGTFTITATRGDDETAIEVSETFTAERRYNDAIIARQDNLYDGNAKMMDKDNITFYYLDNGTLFVNPSAEDMRTACTITGDNQTDAGEYPVTATVDATKNVADGKGVLAIHRDNSVITAVKQTGTYGDAIEMPGMGTLRYKASAVDPTTHGDQLSDVLASGVVAVDARSNSDVDSYEILVAGGKEGHNYNVAYAKSDENHDFEITAKDGLTFSTGTQAGAGMIGETENWREHDGVQAGSYDVKLVDKLTKDASRVFGERNYVLDYETAGLIDGDSFAELTEDGQGGRVDAFEWLHTDSDALEVEAAANRENANGQGQIGDEIDKETGTIHGNGDATITETVNGETIDDTRYGITDDVITSGRVKNYTFNETASTDGTQNIYQRPVTMTAPEAGVLINAGAYTSEELAAAIANQMTITGLASETLKHTYKDLLLTATENGDLAQPGKISVTLTIGNTNYCGADGGRTITISDVTVANVKATATVFDQTNTGFKVKIYIDLGDDGTRPANINELQYRVVRNDGTDTILAQGTMVPDGTRTDADSIEKSFFTTDHDYLTGRVKYLFYAEGYNFGDYGFNP